MLRSIKDLHGYSIHAEDGNIGKVDEFYFDDRDWVIRYMVVNTGNWLAERKVLIAPSVIGQPDWKGRTLPVSLTKEKIMNSPDIDTEKPVSREQEKELLVYYGWPVYWDLGNLSPAGTTIVPVIPTLQEEREQEVIPEENGNRGEWHLRSTNEVASYNIQAKDGKIGHIDDFIADDKKWVIRYIVVDTRNWLPGKKVLVAPHWIESIDWTDSLVSVDLLKEGIKKGPEYNPSETVNREYEEKLCDYYGRPKYWRE